MCTYCPHFSVNIGSAALFGYLGNLCLLANIKSHACPLTKPNPRYSFRAAFSLALSERERVEWVAFLNISVLYFKLFRRQWVERSEILSLAKDVFSINPTEEAFCAPRVRIFDALVLTIERRKDEAKREAIRS